MVFVGSIDHAFWHPILPEQELLLRGADPNVMDEDHHDRGPLYIAARDGHLDVVQVLLNQSTALLASCMYPQMHNLFIRLTGFEICMQMLMQKGRRQEELLRLWQLHIMGILLWHLCSSLRVIYHCCACFQLTHNWLYILCNCLFLLCKSSSRSPAWYTRHQRKDCIVFCGPKWSCRGA